MVFHISLSDKSARFLESGNLRVWTTEENRGFTDDAEGAPGVTNDNKMNKEAKAALLNIVLGSIASYAPVISSRFIKHQSTSLESIWCRLRSFYGFRRTGSRVLQLLELKAEHNESREALWERFYSFIEDQLLTRNGGVLHEGVKIEHDEQLTPTLLNIIVTCWLNAINPALPSVVRQRFTTQLRSNTLYSIREEVSDSIPTLLLELEERDCAVARAGTFQRYKGNGNNQNRNNKSTTDYALSSKRTCCLCQAAGRPASSHFLSACPFLPAADKKYISRAREVLIQPDDLSPVEDEYSDEESSENIKMIKIPHIGRVDVFASPVLEVSVNSTMSQWTLDSGAEANVITIHECKRLGLDIKPTSQRATQGDGKTPLPTYGEVHFTADRGHHKLFFSGLVVKHLDAPVLAGMPFHKVNHLQINFSQSYIILEECCKIKFDSEKKSKLHAKAAALKSIRQICILPGEEVLFELPEKFQGIKSVAVEPRTTVPKDMPKWVKCDIVTPDAEGHISLINSTEEPVLLSKHTQVCQVRPTIEADFDILKSPQPSDLPVVSELSSHNKLSGSRIDLDTSTILTKSDKAVFDNVHNEFQSVFSPGIGCYKPLLQ